MGGPNTEPTELPNLRDKAIAPEHQDEHKSIITGVKQLATDLEKATTYGHIANALRDAEHQAINIVETGLHTVLAAIDSQDAEQEAELASVTTGHEGAE